jgi:hypothetical protein
MSELVWFIDAFMYFRGHAHLAGWVFHPKEQIRGVSARFRDEPLLAVRHSQESADVEAAFGAAARNCRFTAEFSRATTQGLGEMEIVVTLASGRTLALQGLAQHALSTDPYHVLQRRFFEMLRTRGPGTLLEVGARNRSGTVRKGLLPPQMDYVGMDILEGDNVDMVGDAHALSKLFEPGRFDSLLSISVFEHLIMPWKVVLEMNRVLKTGALVLIATHQTFPMHEVPWDFWRFSDRAWRALFNPQTGFRIIDTALGERASVVGHIHHPVTDGMDASPGYLGSAVLCEKSGDTRLQWDVTPEALLDDMYPI